MTYETILVEKNSGIGTIKLNRPDVLNALSTVLVKEVDQAVTEMENDDEIKVVVFTGAGEKAFSAGMDIHEMTRNAESNTPPPVDPNRSKYSWHIGACTKPTIGALNGLSYGGGSVLASSFDIRIGCERSTFKFLAASYGRVNATWSLPMQVGWPKAKELLMTARIVSPDEAFQIGLLNHLVDSSELMNKAYELAEMIAGNDPRMVQGIKELLMGNIGDSWEQTYQNEMDAVAGKLSPTPVLEGFKTFIDRKGRKPE